MRQNDPKLKLCNLLLAININNENFAPIENEAPFDSAVTPWNKHTSSSRTCMC